MANVLGQKSSNVFQIRNIINEQTINLNRFSIFFKGLDSLLTNAENNHPSPTIRDRVAMLNSVWKGKEGFISTPQTMLEVSLLSASIPGIKMSTQSIARFNDAIKAVTKFEEIAEMSTVFYDYVNGSASSIMQAWNCLVGDKSTGAIGFKQDYILPEAYFFVYGPDAPAYMSEPSDRQYAGSGLTDPNGIPYLQKYEIWNLFPTGIELGEHSAESGDARKITSPFQMDNIFPVDIQQYGESTGSNYSDYQPSGAAIG